MRSPRHPFSSSDGATSLRRTAVRLVLRVCVVAVPLLLAWGGSSMAGTLAQLSPVPVPAQDPFYSIPPDIAKLPNGTVLASRPVQAVALAVPIPARAWQVKYKTIDQRGQPSAYVTTILVPLTRGPARAPVRCSPTRRRSIPCRTSARRPTCCGPDSARP